MPSDARTTRLVIGESPSKDKTIAGYLGPDYLVEASIGHVRDLPRNAADVPAEYEGEPVDFLDGTVFTGTESFLTLGSWVDSAPYTSDYTGQQVVITLDARRPMESPADGTPSSSVARPSTNCRTTGSVVRWISSIVPCQRTRPS